VSIPVTATFLPEDTVNVRALVCLTCTALGAPFLGSQIIIEWKTRFTSKLGDAAFRLLRVRFSVPLFRLASIDERRATIVHEVCHILNRELHGNAVQPHGDEWKLLMLLAGELPERCHVVDNSSLKRPAVRESAACACRTHSITRARANKMRAGRHYSCTICKTRLAFANPERSGQ
jgi:SprT protein